MELARSEAVFDPVEHTYTLHGKRLSGITGMIERQLFPGKYEGVPEYIMNRVREKGSYIHTVCELVDDLCISSDLEEARAYRTLCAANGLRYEAGEYLVSDNRRFASCIDKVYRDGESEFSLADIKTTYRLDLDYVRWQLSVYARLFEMQNPGCTVNRLYAIWLRGRESVLKEVERIPCHVVDALMDAEAEGRQFDADTEGNYLPKAPAPKDALPEKYREMEAAIVEMDDMLRKYEGMKKGLLEKVMMEMVKAGVYSWTGERVTFTRKKETVRKTFDKEKFERDHPGEYGNYVKESPVAGSVTMKITK